MPMSRAPKPAPRVTIGVARDEAFCFYYQDNLDFLERAGAKLVEFSPLRDTQSAAGSSMLFIWEAGTPSSTRNS